MTSAKRNGCGNSLKFSIDFLLTRREEESSSSSSEVDDDQTDQDEIDVEIDGQTDDRRSSPGSEKGSEKKNHETLSHHHQRLTFSPFDFQSSLPVSGGHRQSFPLPIPGENGNCFPVVGLNGAQPRTSSESERFFHHLFPHHNLSHQQRKQRPKKFQCPHCQVAFSNNGQLRGHIRIHTGKLSLFLIKSDS